MKNPFSGSRERLQGVGFNLAIQKIIHKVSIEEKKLVKGIAFQSVNDDLPNLETLLGRRSDVLVATIGKSSSSNNNNGSASGILQRLNIATELWNSGLSAEYSLEEKFQTSQDVIKSAAVDGKLIAITLKERQGPMSIKVRNLVTKTETEGKYIEDVYVKMERTRMLIIVLFLLCSLQNRNY